MTACWGIMPAAGIGRRMDAAQPKQYLKVAGKHIIEHSLAPLLQCAAVNRVVVAVGKDDAYWQNTPLKDNPNIQICEGGASRAKSVYSALTKLNADAEDWVVVHDAVRPCLKTKELEHFIKSIWNNPIGAILAISISDSIKRVQQGADNNLCAVETLKRDDLWVRAATPQMFRYRLLCDALAGALADGISIDDEAVAMQHAGHAVTVVLGNERNIKVTYRADLENARRWLSDEQR